MEEQYKRLLKGRLLFKSFAEANNNGKDNIVKIREEINKDIKDDEIIKKYKEAKSRIESDLSNSTFEMSYNTISQKIGENKQNRFIEHYGESQHSIKKYFRFINKKIGRKQCDSIIERSKAYRERMEKAKALEMSTPTAIIYGTKNWSLSLRSSPKCKDIKNYTIPTGTLYHALCIHITENPNSPITVIRKPGDINMMSKSYMNNPFAIEKQKHEYKKLLALLPTLKNKNLLALVV